jgi:signal transduction histidine kinase
VDERARHREVLAINRAIAGAEDYDEVLRRVVEGTAAFTGATACVLLLAQEDGLARVVRSLGIDPTRAAALAVPLSERIDRELCTLLGFQPSDQFVGVPVIGRRGMMGVLAVYRQAPHVADGARDDVLISAFADQAAIALDNAERIRRLREALEREESRRRALLLASVTEDLNKGIDLPHVVNVAIRQGIQVLGRRAGALALLEPDGQHLRGFGEASGGGVTALDDLPNARRALDSRQPHFFTVDQGGGVEAERMRRDGSRALLVVPLLLEERCIGFFFVNYEVETLQPSPDDIVFAKAIAAQCALAIGRIRAYEAECSARSEAERTAKLLEQLMAVVGHDLRTPLSAIHMAVTLMFRRGELSAAQATLLGRIDSSATRMGAIIGDLLDFSLARRGLGIPIQSKRVDLAGVCRRVLAEFEVAGRPVSLVTEGDLTAEADESRFGQVLSNLIGNALQHGGGTQVEVRAHGRDDEVVLEVHNGGSQIPPALLPHIFDPFRRGADAAQSDGASSVGLGLFIVSEIVKAHGGTMEVRSEPGSGTTFAVSLPRHGTAS